MANSIEPVNAVLEEYHKQPDNKKDRTIGEIIQWLLKSGIAVDVAQKLYYMVKTKTCATVIDNLIYLVKNFNASKLPQIKALIEKVPPEVKAICEPLCKEPCVVDKNLERQIADNLLIMKGDMAKSILRNSALISFVLIAVQIAKLITLWSDLSKANNVVDESLKEFPKINEKIDELKKQLVEIKKIMVDYQAETDNEEKTELARDANGLIISLNTTYTATIIMISDIKVKLSTSIERIDLRRNEQMMDGISNTAQGIANLAQYVSLADMTTSGWKIAHGVATGIFFTLAAVNFGAISITSGTLTKLRQNMEFLMKLEKELAEIYKEINVAEKWFKEIRQRKRQAKK